MTPVFSKLAILSLMAFGTISSALPTPGNGGGPGTGSGTTAGAIGGIAVGTIFGETGKALASFGEDIPEPEKHPNGFKGWLKDSIKDFFGIEKRQGGMGDFSSGVSLTQVDYDVTADENHDGKID